MHIGEGQLISEVLQLLEPYPSKFLENALRLVQGDVSEQLLSDRLIWYELDMADVAARLTQLLLDADGAAYLSVRSPSICTEMHFSSFIDANIAKIVNYFRVVWIISNDVLKLLRDNELPLMQMGLLVMQLNMLHAALAQVEFE